MTTKPNLFAETLERLFRLNIHEGDDDDIDERKLGILVNEQFEFRKLHSTKFQVLR